MATSTYMRLNPQDDPNTRRMRDKRFTHHSSSSNHHHPHIRVVRASTDQAGRPPQRKLREKRRMTNNTVSDSRTEGTTSEDAGEELQYSSEDVPDTQNKIDQLFKKMDVAHLASDLEADCEDNNSTDVDTVSVSGSIKHKTPNCMEKSLEEEGFYLLPSSTVTQVPGAAGDGKTTPASQLTGVQIIALSTNSGPPHVCEQKHQLMSAKIRNLERQLETVLTLNVKLKEENEKLKKMAASVTSQASSQRQ